MPFPASYRMTRKKQRAEGIHNYSTSSATGLSPIQCVYGYQPPVFPRTKGILLLSPGFHLLVLENPGLCQSRPRQSHPAPFHNRSLAAVYQVCQVSLKTSACQRPQRSWPVTIHQVVRPTVLRLELPTSGRIHPAFHVSKNKPAHESPLNPALPSPPSPCTINGSSV